MDNLTLPIYFRYSAGQLNNDDNLKLSFISVSVNAQIDE